MDKRLLVLKHQALASCFLLPDFWQVWPVQETSSKNKRLEDSRARQISTPPMAAPSEDEKVSATDFNLVLA
ncbi:MAG: hypothetical protein KGZ75_12810 [Syntrophomonadaceae bacterium]|nr:hypothetical protein [Syntrophomonadaceae bacterium]